MHKINRVLLICLGWASLLISACSNGSNSGAGSTTSSAAVKTGDQVEDYLCYEDASKQTGIDISINHSDLVVYTVALKTQNGGMYSDHDGRESIVTYRQERNDGAGSFSLDDGTVVPDSSGRYTDALGFVHIDFQTVNGLVESFVGIKSDGSQKSYINCSLRSSRS